MAYAPGLHLDAASKETWTETDPDEQMASLPAA